MNPCEERPTAPLYMVLISYLSHAVLIFYGYLNEFLISINKLKSFEVKELNRDSYTPLYDKFSTFYYRHIIRRMANMWQHPICSAPGPRIDILERKFNAYNIKWK
jgi:serine palmitoyltransferase